MEREPNPVGIGEASKILGWSTETLRRWANAGVLPSGAVELSPGGHRRFRVGVIQRWAQERALRMVNSKRRGTFVEQGSTR